MREFPVLALAIVYKCNPRWAANDPGSFRAFVFPVLQPSSVLYVCATDYDGTRGGAKIAAGAPESPDERAERNVSNKRSGINEDDPIGRCAIQIGRLVSSTVYDCEL